jgi:hypothetical protein
LPTQTTPTATLIRTAKSLGLPADQLRAFLAGGYVPQPKQMEFHAAARACDAAGPDQVLFGGARGPGKSHGVFAQIALDDCQRVPGVKVLYLRRVGKNAREQFDDLRRKVLYATPHHANRNTGLVEFPNGSRIYVGGFQHEQDVDKFLGLEYPIIALEELTTLSLTKYRALRDSNRSGDPRLRARLYASTNPGGVGHAWVKQRFVEPHRAGREERTRFIPATVDDNAFVGADYHRRLEENTGWRLRAYRYGDWDIAAGQFFDTWRHAVHVIEPFPIPPDWPVWASMDYGYTHPTVIHLFAQDGDGNRYVLAEHAARRQLPPYHAAQYRAALARLGVAEPRVWPFVAGADVFARRGSQGQTVAEQYAAAGIHLTPADSDRIQGAAHILRLLGNPDFAPDFSAAKPGYDEEKSGAKQPDALPPRLFVCNTCPRLIEQLPAMVHDPHRPEDVRKVAVDEEGRGGDDAYDCARYGLMVKEPGGGRPAHVVPAPDPIRVMDRGAF